MKIARIRPYPGLYGRTSTEVVLSDGSNLEGVASVSYLHDAGDLPRLTIEVLVAPSVLQDEAEQ